MRREEILLETQNFRLQKLVSLLATKENFLFHGTTVYSMCLSLASFYQNYNQISVNKSLKSRLAIGCSLTVKKTETSECLSGRIGEKIPLVSLFLDRLAKIGSDGMTNKSKHHAPFIRKDITTIFFGKITKRFRSRMHHQFHTMIIFGIFTAKE